MAFDKKDKAHFCGGLFIYHLITHQQLVLQIVWELVEWNNGPIGMFGMILPLTNRVLIPFCRLYHWLLIGYIYSPISSW
jgi:hypothetical protein